MYYPEDQGSLKAIFFILCGLSIVSELFIILSYLSIRRKTTRFYNQVVWLFGTDVICFTSYFYSILPNSNNATLCGIFGFINEVSHVSSIFWTSIIAITIFYSIKTQQRIASLPTKYIIIISALSFVFPIYPLISNEYGAYEGFGFPLCWISSPNASTYIIAYWVPVVGCIIFNICCYIGIIAYIRKNVSGQVSKEFSILFIFPLVQIVSNSGSLISSLFIVNNTAPTENIQLIHVITRSVEGLLNVIAYGSNYSIRNDIKKVWCKRRKISEDVNVKDNNADNKTLFLDLPSIN